MAREATLTGRFDRTLDARTYRWLDRTTKLAGLALVAVALETGPTPTGLALAATGTGLGLTTIPLENDE